MTTIDTPEATCPNCDTAVEVVRERRTVPLGQRRVEIEDEFFKCRKCDEEFYSIAQANQRHVRAIDRARSNDNLLTPSQIKAVRESLNLSQRQFELLLGVGEKTCIRWEQGKVCQNAATDRLIRLLASDRENVRRLAAINGVALPDSCYVPALDVRSKAYEVAFDDWSRESLNPFQAPQLVRMGGTHERHLLDVVEYNAIVEGATTTIPTWPVVGSLRKKAEQFRDLLGGSDIQ